ncbi:HlyD family secretion protein [Pedobacter sp. BG31]|uniref:HlyD family secretion protein n=1 Tax=Pedobacter sp. BG31 TaxID=3349697 RepID=UPI0035F3BC1C
MEQVENLKGKEIILLQEIRSEEVSDIITAVPHWIIRCGVTLLFGILIIIILCSNLISYPETINAELKVKSVNPPIIITAQQSGIVKTVFATDGDFVKQGKVLAWLESPGSHNDILYLAKKIDEIRSDFLKRPQSPNIVLPKGLNLGSLEKSYQYLNISYLKFISGRNNSYLSNKIKILEKDINRLSQKIIHKQYRSEAEFKTLDTEITELQKEYSALAQQRDEEQLQFSQSLISFQDEIGLWKSAHILTAPSDGKLNYIGLIQTGTTVVQNQKVFIINKKAKSFYGEIRIPESSIVKIKKGQQVIVKLHSYPYQQYGLLRGRLSSVSEFAYNDSLYLARVDFAGDKKVNNKIILKNGMSADVEVIVHEYSLLARFINNLQTVINQDGK